LARVYLYEFHPVLKVRSQIRILSQLKSH
jgi:hypothetical protein